MRPFLRWAGGKRWLASTGSVRFPKARRYVEPFLGGGAIFFSQDASGAVLSDLNPYLINAYRWMRDDPSHLCEALQKHFDLHDSDYYYSVRGQLGFVSLDDAAAMIYLNRACFNGLFRVNLAGKFNVPIGTKLYELRDRQEFTAWSEKLKTAEIIVEDFETVIDRCEDGDFVFLDPPYTVKHNGNGFIEYNEKIFSWDDQVRLAACLSRASDRGVEFLLTNGDHDNVRALYSDRYTLVSQERGSEMAGKAAHRGQTTELLVASSHDLVFNGQLL
ncbi:MAG: Dam family site-specific DNA-(adenine-N6)-methyltransferase [Sphingomonas sp.]|nr:Dam family site-specific DNA-(adenine-N6)-methyltransferase [Sphingomonas sp.]